MKRFANYELSVKALPYIKQSPCELQSAYVQSWGQHKSQIAMSVRKILCSEVHESYSLAPTKIISNGTDNL